MWHAKLQQIRYHSFHQLHQTWLASYVWNKPYKKHIWNTAKGCVAGSMTACVRVCQSTVCVTYYYYDRIIVQRCMVLTGSATVYCIHQDTQIYRARKRAVPGPRTWPPHLGIKTAVKKTMAAKQPLLRPRCTLWSSPPSLIAPERPKGWAMDKTFAVTLVTSDSSLISLMAGCLTN